VAKFFFKKHQKSDLNKTT